MAHLEDDLWKPKPIRLFRLNNGRSFERVLLITARDCPETARDCPGTARSRKLTARSRKLTARDK